MLAAASARVRCLPPPAFFPRSAPLLSLCFVSAVSPPIIVCSDPWAYASARSRVVTPAEAAISRSEKQKWFCKVASGGRLVLRVRPCRADLASRAHAHASAMCSGR